MPSAAGRSPNPLAYESFRPNLPLDPFHSVPPRTVPWSLDVDDLPSLAEIQAECRIIVVLGQPSAADLQPLFESKQLASSLVIVASHEYLSTPTESQPAVHLLQLIRPVTVEETGAARLINVLEWAVLAVRNWRKPGAPKFLVYTEVRDDEPGSESVGSHHHSGSHIRYVVSSGMNGSTSSREPNSSSTSVKNPVNAKRRLSFLRAPKLSNTSHQFHAENSLLAHPEQRPFDAIFHYLPSDLPEKSLLKAVILVTTLTRPYLANAPIRSPGTRFWMEADPVPKQRVRKRWSLFGSRRSSPTADSQQYQPRSSSSTSNSPSNSTSDSYDTTMSMIQRQRHSHIVHLMPFSLMHTNSSYAAGSQERLIRSIESFLVSFSYPVATRSMPSFDPDFARARPYIIPAKTLSNYLTFVNSKTSLQSSTDHGNENIPRSKWTLADLILCGALDQPDVQAVLGTGEEKSLSDVALGKRRSEDLPGSGASINRCAWLSSIRDLRIAVRSNSECSGVRVYSNGSSHERRPGRRRPKELGSRHNKPLPTPPEDEFEDFEEIEADSSATISTVMFVGSSSSSKHDQHQGIPPGSSSLRETQPSISATVPLSSHTPSTHKRSATVPVVHSPPTSNLPNAAVKDKTAAPLSHKPAKPAPASTGIKSSDLHRTPTKKIVLPTPPSSNNSCREASVEASRGPKEKAGIVEGEQIRSHPRRRGKDPSRRREVDRSNSKRTGINALSAALSVPIAPERPRDRTRRAPKKDGQTSLREKDGEKMKRGQERKREKLDNRSRSRGMARSGY